MNLNEEWLNFNNSNDVIIKNETLKKEKQE